MTTSSPPREVLASLVAGTDAPVWALWCQDDMPDGVVRLREEARQAADRLLAAGFRRSVVSTHENCDYGEGYEEGFTAGKRSVVSTPTDEMVERAARAGFECVRNLRPKDHGPYRDWSEESEQYREYLRCIQRAALRAALEEQ